MLEAMRELSIFLMHVAKIRAIANVNLQKDFSRLDLHEF